MFLSSAAWLSLALCGGVDAEGIDAVVADLRAGREERGLERVARLEPAEVERLVGLLARVEPLGEGESLSFDERAQLLSVLDRLDPEAVLGAVDRRVDATLPLAVLVELFAIAASTGDPRAVDSIVGTFDAVEESARQSRVVRCGLRSALQAVAESEAQAALAVARVALDHESSLLLASDAVEALGETRSPVVVPALERVLASSRGLEVDALQALGQLELRLPVRALHTARDLVEAALLSRVSAERAAAATALATLGNFDSATALAPLVEDDDLRTRLAARATLTVLARRVRRSSSSTRGASAVAESKLPSVARAVAAAARSADTRE
ncbi:MAG: hypothetical protein AAFZ65_08570, partial [Planctomycetota bacterium]